MPRNELISMRLTAPMDSIQAVRYRGAYGIASPDMRGPMWGFRLAAGTDQDAGLQRIRMGETGSVPLLCLLPSYRCAATIKDTATGFRLVVTSPSP
jgi:hypothetical protein